MLIINPQWQGAGFTDELKHGADTLANYFGDGFEMVPLSVQPLDEVHQIKCFHPILEQTTSFRNIIQEHQPRTVTTIGGDCGVEIIPISYLNQIYDGDLCVIWMDGHADLNTPASSPSKTFHGMPLRTLLGEGNEQINAQLPSFINPEQVCFVGLRELDEPEQEYISLHQMTALPTADYRSLQQVILEKRFRKIYIHLDLDVLNAGEFPHTLFPSDKGLPVTQVTGVIKGLKQDFDVVGIGITECSATSIAALQPISEILQAAR